MYGNWHLDIGAKKGKEVELHHAKTRLKARLSIVLLGHALLTINSLLR